MNKIANTIILFLLFAISATVAIYIIKNSAAPWKLISIYWLTATIKNGVDFINERVKR